MPGLLAVLIVALASAALAALVIAVVLLRRQGRLDVRRGLATTALGLVAGAAAVAGVASLQPAPLPAEPVSAVTNVTEVQLSTLALDDAG